MGSFKVTIYANRFSTVESFLHPGINLYNIIILINYYFRIFGYSQMRLLYISISFLLSNFSITAI